jgi:PAS domain S-box-containing protein
MVQPKKKSSRKKQKQAPDLEELSSPVKSDFNELAPVQKEVIFQQMIGEVEDYAIILLNTDGKICTWNKGAEKIKGYKAEEIIGKNYKLFYAKEDRVAQLPEQLLNKAIESGKAYHEGWRVRKDGTRFWGNILITALHNDEKEITGFLKITRDLSEKKKAEDIYSNYVEELKLKNEALKKSEERYHKMVLEVQDYAIILLDKSGKVLDWNKGAEKLKGYSTSEILGKSFRLFYTKEDKDSNLPDALLKIATEKGSVNHEGWRIRKGGNRFWGNVAITALHNDEGEVIGFSKVTRDLTEKKIAEDHINNYAEELKQKIDDLRKSEERYYKMISEIQDYAIILLDKKGIIQNWNIGAQYIKGYQASEIVGKSFKIFYTKEDRESGLPGRLLNLALSTGKATQEGWRVRKDGTKFWGSIVITALHDTQGNVIGFSKVTRDLTEKKQAEDLILSTSAQLDLKNKALERLNAELTSFTYIASHDLKEPLRKIQAFASMMEGVENMPEKGNELLEKIKSSALRMQTLMEDLLSYSLISNDNSSFEKIDLNETLNAAKADLEMVIEEKQGVIKSEKLPVIFGVSFQLQQLFLNLLSNALKFSKENEAPIINISSRVIEGPEIPGNNSIGQNKYYLISVSDNGIGFESQYATKIFGAFQRLHAKSAFSGTGIGLAIVKKVIENHNGIIVAEGIPDVGATFHLYLPISKTGNANE